MNNELSNLCEKDYYLRKSQSLNNLVASDLEKIIETVQRKIPNSVIILGGSLAYGEGKSVPSGKDLVSCSDYDIFVIVPSLYKVLHHLISNDLRTLLSELKLSNSLELVVVWEGVLNSNLSTVAGEILVGRDRAEKQLDHMSIPEPVNNLKRAFKSLLCGISEKENQGKYLRSSIIQTFQAFLLSLAKREKQKYEVWNNIYSLKYDLQKAETYRDYLGEPTYQILENTLVQTLADEPPQEFSFDDFAVIRDFVNRIYFDIQPTFKINDYIRYLTFNIRDGRLPNPICNSIQLYCNTAFLLSTSVESTNSFDEGKLQEAETTLHKLAGYKISSESPEIRFSRCVQRIIHYNETYLHKITLN